MNEQSMPKEAEEYLRRLRQGLAELSADHRDEILAELRSHLAERHRRGAKDLLEGFDAPESYASEFLAESALRGAVARGTSVALGRALLIGAGNGLVRLITLAPLFLLHLIGGALVVVGALELFIPSRVGLFLDGGGQLVALGAYGGELEGTREVLGLFALPLFVLTGVALIWLANRGLRALARRRLASLPQVKS